MKTLLKTVGLISCLCIPLALSANEARPASGSGGSDAPEQDMYAWEGTIDFLRVPQGEIVVGDKMFLFSTNTVITKRGQKAPVPLSELSKGMSVKVTPLLPVPEMATPRAIQIEILK